LWSYNEHEEDIAPIGMALAYQDDEIDQTLHDVILDGGLGDGSELPVPITGEENVVAAAEVDAISQQELSDVDGSILKMRTMTLYGNTSMKMTMLPMKVRTTRISNQ
jgi:hypothetical protein